MSDVWKRLRAGAESLREETASLCSELIRIPSPSRAEGAAIEFIRRKMEDIGFDEVKRDAMGNLVGSLGRGGIQVAFDAHIDVVDVVDGGEWDHPPYGGDRDGGNVYGRGACDQKGAIASLLSAAKLMRRPSLADICTIRVVITVQEEDCEGLCWCHLIEEEGLRPDAVVITEPSALRLSLGQKGKVQMVVETAGAASHGSAPERGVNAIYAMAPIVAGIERLNERLPAAPPFGKGTVTVSGIESRAPSLCSVPDLCRIHLDRRLTRDEDREAALSQVEEIAAPHGGRVRVPVYGQASYTGLVRRREEYYPSWLTAGESAIARALLAAHREVFGREAETCVWDFSTNGIATSGLHGIPTIGFGPGDPKAAHTRDESVPVDHLTAAAALYAAFPWFYARESK